MLRSKRVTTKCTAYQTIGDFAVVTDGTQFELELGNEKEEQICSQKRKEFNVKDFYRNAVENILQPKDCVAEKVFEDVGRAQQLWNNANECNKGKGSEEEFIAVHLRSLGYKAEVLAYSLMYQGVEPVLSMVHKCRKNSNYLWILPQIEEYDMDEFILELNFKTQFATQNPSQRYQDFLTLVPEVFIGTHEDLQYLVGIVCNEMARSFAASGRSLPPWRRHEAVKAHWGTAASTEGQERAVCQSLMPKNFKILTNRNVHFSQKGCMSLLSSELAGRTKGKTIQITKPKPGLKDNIRHVMNKCVFRQSPNHKMPVTKCSQCTSPSIITKQNKESMLVDALIAQLNRGWFGISC